MVHRARLHLNEPLPRLLADLAAFFAGRGIEAYLVGGFLRDVLLKGACRDIDVSIAADPLAIGPELADTLRGHFFPIGQEQRVARVFLPEGQLHIDLLPLREDIATDLGERDYTIDAMAAPLAEAASGDAVTIIDPWGGRRDLRQRLVRVIGEEAFRHDPLRLLRGVRLCAELGFRLEPTTQAMIRSNGHRLREAAAERQREELMRILATPRAALGLRLLDQLGLLGLLLPELEAARGVQQPKEHHWDVFHHLLETVACLDMLLDPSPPPPTPGGKGRGTRVWTAWVWREVWQQLPWLDIPTYFRQEILSGRPRAAVLKLAALLHDIAKPQTKSFDKAGRMRFFGHSEQGADMATAILRRLRFSAREVEMVRLMVAHHLRPVQLGQQTGARWGPPTRRALYRFFRDGGDVAMELLFLSLADHLATVGPGVRREDWRNHVALVNYMLAQRYQEAAIVAPPKLVSGHDLMAELGLAPGPIIGRLLEAIREAQAAGEVSTRQEALALARRELERVPLALSLSKGEPPDAATFGLR